MMEKAKRFIPFTLYWDDLPVDLSFLYENEKPAGRHGFLKVEKDKFRFEDGTEARFWGTNFNSAGNFPSHEHSEKLAARLEKTGLNLVRLHQLDAEWSTPNIFRFTKGSLQEDTLSLDPKSMDRMDYLIYCLKNHGIYIYMDLLTYRKFKPGDGLENTGSLKDAAKPYTNYNRRLIELQKLFNEQVWNHTNPYTGLAYKDEPSVVLTEIANENELFNQKANPIVLEPYKSELEGKYREWARRNGTGPVEGGIDFSSQDKTMLRFLCDVQKSYYIEMMEHLRGIGVKIPIAGTNWAFNAALLSCQLVTDFTDNHTYWYDWNWSELDKRFNNRSMTSGIWNITTALPFMRVLDKPFFVSEWDDPWPNEWRAESPLLMAAVGSLQGWTGFAIHTYRYDTDEKNDMLGKEITSGAIGGIHYRGGIFDTFNDPAKYGLFYHAALLFRRGDVKEASQCVNVKVEDLGLGIVQAGCLAGLTEKHKTGMLLPEQKGVADMTVLPDEIVVDPEKGEVSSDTGEMYRSWDKKAGWIDTPGTKAVYGFIGGCGEISLKDMSIKAKTDFATIAVSSLTEEPLSDSPNILLTAAGRADNSESSYNESHTVQLQRGHAPAMIEVVEAEIKLKTRRENLKVWAVSDRGFFIGAVPSKYENGLFRFETGGEFASMYYLIQAQ